MANQLVSSSKLSHPAQRQGSSSVRVMLYREDSPQGCVFEGAEAVEKAAKDGWVDTPKWSVPDGAGSPIQGPTLDEQVIDESMRRLDKVESTLLTAIEEIATQLKALDGRLSKLEAPRTAVKKRG